MANNWMIYAGIAVGIAAIAGIVVYGTSNQQNYVADDAVLAPAANQGSITSGSGLGAELNKERWHEDPFGDLAKEVREKYEAEN